MSTQPSSDLPSEGRHRVQTFTLELLPGSGDSIGPAGDRMAARIAFNGWLSFIVAVTTIRRETSFEAR